jgi:hypothetical protein
MPSDHGDMGDLLERRVRPGRLLIVVCAVVLLVVFLAACGGGESDSAVASAASDDTSGGDSSGGDSAGGGSADDTEEELLDWVECMRDEGVDVPDPQVDADGNLTFGGGGGPGLGGGGGGGIDREALQDATEVCGEIPQGAFGGERPDQTEVQDRLLEFAQCMRDNGYDMPDPDFSGDGGLTSAFGDIDTNDPVFQDASAACEDIFAGGLGGGEDGSSGEG